MKMYSLVFLVLLFSVRDTQPMLMTKKPVVANIVFKSIDGGRYWEDISEGLPENLQQEEVQRDGFFANGNGFYLRADNRLYHNKPTSTAPFWDMEIFPARQDRIASGKAGIFAFTGNPGIFAYDWNGHFLQKKNGTGMWSPVFTNFLVKEIRIVFETPEGMIFIGCESGLFKSADSGKSWKQVYQKGWVIKVVESNGLLVATSQKGIIRSTDGGENWEQVLYEGGVGIDIQPIEGGFAAIVANTQVMARTVRTSYDEGKTWQSIDTGLPADLRTSSIIEVGKIFFCGHPAGIFRSEDKGKTWQLLFPSVNDKVFNLFVSGNVIYAILRGGGC